MIELFLLNFAIFAVAFVIFIGSLLTSLRAAHRLTHAQRNELFRFTTAPYDSKLYTAYKKVSYDSHFYAVMLDRNPYKLYDHCLRQAVGK